MDRAKPLAYFKAGLSLFIVFQLFVVLVQPNVDNYIGSKAKGVLEPYVGFFELSNKWSFFAPEPGPPPVFVDWALLDSKGEQTKTGRFPEPESPFFFRDRQNRRIAAVEFIMPTEERVEKVMVPYLCGQYPEAYSVKLWRLAYQVPPLEAVAKGTRKIGDEVNLERRLVSHTFCERSL